MTQDLSGSYEVLRKRLEDAAAALSGKVTALDARRVAAHGGGAHRLLGPARLRTEGACVVVDAVRVGDLVVVGLVTQLGLRKEVLVEDVLVAAVLVETAEGPQLERVSDARAAWLQDGRFLKDLRELFSYYRNARLIRLQAQEGRLLVVFRVGERAVDQRVFHWEVKDGLPVFVDNRGDKLLGGPPAHDFTWTPTTREDHRLGRFPHVSVRDLVFVETVGGDLTIKVENNTEDGLGIWREPVDDPRQSLDDAVIEHARIGSLVLLRIRPYGEAAFRHLVFHSRTQSVVRLDGVGMSCVRLLDDHGIVFPGGFVLETGESRTFAGRTDLVIDRVVRAPNGEDVLYVFRAPDDGRYVLYPYNLVRREVAGVMEGAGIALLADGRLLLPRGDDADPVRVHGLQVWQTTFCSPEHEAARPLVHGLLGRVGNADLVRGIADALALARRVALRDPTRAVYTDISAAAVSLLDDHPWLAEAEAGAMAGEVGLLRATAEAILGEYDRMEALRRHAAEVLGRAEREHAALAGSIRPELWQEAAPFLQALSKLRLERGHLGTLAEVRFIDRERLARLAGEAASLFQATALAAARFLADPAALADVAARIGAVASDAGAVARSPDLAPLDERLAALIGEVEALAEVASNLPVADPALRTALVQRTAEVSAHLNRARAVLQGRRQEVEAAELRDEFGARFALLAQTVDTALAGCDTPERCDEQLARVLLQVEELEGRFGEVGEFLSTILTRREEIQAAFEARRQQLVDARQQRIGHLVEAAVRVLDGVGRRAAAFKEVDELRAFFVGDAMAEKVRQLSAQIRQAGDAGRSEELLGRLKSVEQAALRTLQDRSELYEGDGQILRLGSYRFAVQPLRLELTLLPREDGLSLHLAGTDLYEAVDDPRALELREAWSHALPSESPELSRAEHLAATLLVDAEAGQGAITVDALRQAVTPSDRLALVQQAAARRIDDGYERGVHDHDAAAILGALVALSEGAGRLRWPATARALGLAWWTWGAGEGREATVTCAQSLGHLRADLGDVRPLQALGEELGGRIGAWQGDLLPGDPALAGAWLAEELSRGELRPVLSVEADAVVRAAHARWGGLHAPALGGVEVGLRERLSVVRAWVDAVIRQDGALEGSVALEATVALLVGDLLPRKVSAAAVQQTVTGLLSQHPRLVGGAVEVRLDDLLGRLANHRRVHQPRWERWRSVRHELLEAARARLRLDELIPRPMTSFVRNRLIQEVYLPLIGANLAKQLGAMGDGKRTDQMGLLLLVSPPGYGKTTLMEYLAQRLGLIFVKVNGPALGHAVTSLDPAEAPDQTSRQEVARIGLALEMGSNVMLYLDDIQHTHPELLQKFISLCDGTRRIEGVWNGRSRTYDLRGKRFCVVMAGNPYTESGERFRIPDMLANRADTYNLGDILSGAQEAFAESFLENALTSNPTLAPIAARAPADLRPFLRLARGQDVEESAFTHDWSAMERQDIVATLRHLMAVQHTLLEVNRAYIASAASADASRTEPPFKLQGSYRNMNKLAEKVVPAMTPEEVQALITDHYRSESQTLTSSAEANLLKLALLRGMISEAQQARWAQICHDWRRLVLAGGQDDPAARVTGALFGVSERLEARLLALGEQLGTAGVEAQLEALVQRAGVSEDPGPLDGLVRGLTQAVTGPSAEIGRALTNISLRLGSGGPLVERLATLEGVLAAIFADLGADHPDAVRRQEVLLAELGSDADEMESADPVLAATVPIIRQIATRTLRLLTAFVPPERGEEAAAAWRREVAQVVGALASARAGVRVGG